MNTATKLGGFTLGLLAVFGAAAGIGNAVGPIGPAGDDAPHDGGAHTSASATADSATAEELPGGLMISQDGYTLDLDDAELPALVRALDLAGLPSGDVHLPGRRFFRFMVGGEDIGHGGLEGVAPDMLVRSVVVCPERRGTGSGAWVSRRWTT